MVELDEQSGLVAKTTRPPGFGLIPEVRTFEKREFRSEGGKSTVRQAIEFFVATPLEYLSRWLANNEVFLDDVRLVSMIRWADGLASFGIVQSQYHGEPAELRDIEEHFRLAGWERLSDPSGHTVFFNHAFGVMAIDVERRNCFVNEEGLQPFDVILREPDDALEKFLNIYPE